MDVIKKLGPVELVALPGLSYLWAAIKPKGKRGQPRAVGLQPLRQAALPALLQVLHREGLGRPDHRAARRVGRPADQGPVVLLRRQGRVLRQQGQQDQVADQRVPLPALRPGPDVGDDGRRDHRPRRRGPAQHPGHEARGRATAGSSRSRPAASASSRARSSPRCRCARPSAWPAPPRPATVQAARQGLRYRDFLTVALVIDGEDLFPDNWIYIHEPGVRVGRIQNFRSWSPWMVPDPSKASVGLEYFCFQGDDLWDMDDDDLVELGQARARAARPRRPGEGRARLRHARAARLPDVRRRLRRARATRSAAGSRASSNLQQVGRNGLHRYNNSDHSMLTAIRAVENIIDGHEPRHLGGQRGVRLPRGETCKDEHPYKRAPRDEGHARAARLRRFLRSGSRERTWTACPMSLRGAVHLMPSGGRTDRASDGPLTEEARKDSLWNGRAAAPRGRFSFTARAGRRPAWPTRQTKQPDARPRSDERRGRGGQGGDARARGGRSAREARGLARRQGEVPDLRRPRPATRLRRGRRPPSSARPSSSTRGRRGEIDGEEVDDPEEYKGEPIPGGPTDEDSSAGADLPDRRSGASSLAPMIDRA